MALRQVLLLTLAATPSIAHMSLVSPFPRNAVDKADPRWADGKWWPYVPTCPKSEQKYPSNPQAPGWNSQIPSGCVPNGTDGWGCNCANGTGMCNVGQSCLWFSQGMTIGCKVPTGDGANPNTKACFPGCGCDSENPVNSTLPASLRTYNRNSTPFSDEDVYKHNPWRAPGHAPVWDPCGMAGGGPKKQGGEAKYTETKYAKQGDLGSKVLPYSPTGIKWKAGATGTTKWSIRSNHGGGYSFRLCKRSEELTEECMQRTPLKFAQSFHRLEFNDGTNITIPGHYVSTGTKPAGSQWAMNPLPYTCPTPGPACSWEVQSFKPPCLETLDRTKTDTGRCSGRDPFNTLIVDELSIPAHLEPGEYVLGIRWDCEKSAQIWQNCADIEIVA